MEPEALIPKCLEFCLSFFFPMFLDFHIINQLSLLEDMFGKANILNMLAGDAK